MGSNLKPGKTKRCLCVEFGSWHQDTAIAYALSTEHEVQLLFRHSLDKEIVKRSPICINFVNIFQIFLRAVTAREIYINTCERPLPITFLIFCRLLLRKRVFVLVHNLDYFKPSLAKPLTRRWFMAVANSCVRAHRYYTISPFLKRNARKKFSIELEVLPVSGLQKIAYINKKKYSVIVGGIVPWRKNVNAIKEIDFKSSFSGEMAFCVAGDITLYEGPNIKQHIEELNVNAMFFERSMPYSEFIDTIGSAAYMFNLPTDDRGYESIKSSAAVFYSRALDLPLVSSYGSRYIMCIGDGMCWHSHLNSAIQTMHSKFG